ncbi:alpha/beta hydrolase [Pelomyxa schiedti]|nr:alpha/beta hydrolase [Pelomyxa schiedti]
MVVRGFPVGVVVAILIGCLGCNGQSCEPTRYKIPVKTAGGLEMPYYLSPESTLLGGYFPGVVEVVIVQHGMDRNADDYLCYMIGSRDIAYPLGNSSILILSFQFQQYPDDNPGMNDLFWDDESWNMGGHSSQKQPWTISSFAVTDYMISLLLQHANFPDLREIVFAGHSAGGQFSTRYAQGNLMPQGYPIDSSPIHVRYVVANPSSYGYMNAERALTGSDPFSIPDSSDCPTYNQWRYGLDELNEYMSIPGVENIILNYKPRDVVYLLGTNDTCNELLDPTCDSHGLDTGCEAMMQGRWRYERGTTWFRFLDYFYGETVQREVDVPGVGHDGEAMFQSPQGVEVIFFDF